MNRRAILAAAVVFAAWGILDFVIHGLILGEAYTATSHVWRPMGQMKTGLTVVSILAYAFCFVFLYTWFVDRKSMARAVAYGLVLGVGVGISMVYGTYAVLPIPYFMALTWFLGTVAESLVGALILGWIVKPAPEPGENAP